MLIWRVRDALSLGAKRCQEKQNILPETLLLLAHALGCTVEDVYLHPERVVTPPRV